MPLRYGHHRGSPELRELIAQDYEGFSPDQIAVTTGASEANFAVIASLVGPNDHIIVEHPNYPSLYEVPRSLNRPLDLLRLTFEEKFKPNLEKLETYRELSFKKPLPPAATLSPHAISITSMSKVCGLSGIRIGWVAADRHIIESVRAVREQLTICNSVIGEEITMNILRRKQDFLKNVKKRVASNLKVVEGWMKRQEDLEWIRPEGGVVGFPRFKMDMSTDDLCLLLAKKYKTFVVPGYCFEMNRHFRLGFGGEAEELKAGLNCVASTTRQEPCSTTQGSASGPGSS